VNSLPPNFLLGVDTYEKNKNYSITFSAAYCNSPNVRTLPATSVETNAVFTVSMINSGGFGMFNETMDSLLWIQHWRVWIKILKLEMS
jgi:hypothetical protein